MKSKEPITLNPTEYEKFLDDLETPEEIKEILIKKYMKHHGLKRWPKKKQF